MEIPYTPPNQEQLLEANEELFCRPSAIPVRTRLRYLVENDRDPAKYHIDDFLELDEFAASIGQTEDEIFIILRELNVPQDMMPRDSFGNFMLMPGMDIVIKEELAWREFYDGMDEMSVPFLAGYFGFSDRSIRTMIKRTGIEPKVLNNGVLRYPKQLAYRVRAELMMFPPARDNKSANQLADTTGKSGPWLDSRLDAEFYDVDLNPGTPHLAEYGGDLMRNKNNKIITHYGRPLVALIVEDAKKQKFREENSKAVKETARDIGRDYAWVKTRTLKAKTDVAHGRVRVDEQQRLQVESDRQRNLEPFSADEMTIKQVAKSLGVGSETVDEVCANIGLRPNQRRTKNNRIANAYITNDQLQIAEGVCKKYTSSIKKLEDELSSQRLSGAESHITKVNLGRMRKLYRNTLDTYQRLLEEAQEDA